MRSGEPHFVRFLMSVVLTEVSVAFDHRNFAMHIARTTRNWPCRTQTDGYAKLLFNAITCIKKSPIRGPCERGSQRHGEIQKGAVPPPPLVSTKVGLLGRDSGGRRILRGALSPQSYEWGFQPRIPPSL